MLQHTTRDIEQLAFVFSSKDAIAGRMYLHLVFYPSRPFAQPGCWSRLVYCCLIAAICFFAILLSYQSSIWEFRHCQEPLAILNVFDKFLLLA
jgi:hypothetical protein